MGSHIVHHGPNPQIVGCPLFNHLVDNIPVELSFLRFKIGPCQANVQVIHARKLSQVGIFCDAIMVEAVVGKMLIPSLVRIFKRDLIIPVAFQVDHQRCRCCR